MPGLRTVNWWVKNNFKEIVFEYKKRVPMNNKLIFVFIIDTNNGITLFIDIIKELMSVKQLTEYNELKNI